MQDQIELRRELLIDLRNDGLDRADDIVGDDGALPQSLFGERANGIFDLRPRPIGFGLELLLQQRRKLIGFGNRGGGFLVSFSFTHSYIHVPGLFARPFGLGAGGQRLQ